MAVESQILLLALLPSSTKEAKCVGLFKQGGEFMLKFICKGRVTDTKNLVVWMVGEYRGASVPGVVLRLYIKAR